MVFAVSWESKGIWGFVAGALSTWAYAILQAVFKRMFGFDISNFTRSGHPAALPGIAPVAVPPPAALPPTIPPPGSSGPARLPEKKS
jgi:hypothetical protein